MNDMLKLVQALAAASIPNTEQEAVAGLRVEAAHVAFAERIYELFLRREGDPAWTDLAEGLAKTIVEKVATQLWPLAKPSETAIADAAITMMDARQRFMSALLRAGQAPTTLEQVHLRLAQDEAQFDMDAAVQHLERLLTAYKSRRGDARLETT